MSSTVRCIMNNKRIATGTPWGIAFLQVYPEQKTFASEEHWRCHIYESLTANIRFETGGSNHEESDGETESNVVANPTVVTASKQDWLHVKSLKSTLPPGTYYIGDLCYALDDYLYDHVFGPSYQVGKFVSAANPKHVFMMGHTTDGLYHGTDGKEYAVDAGIIGIASVDTLNPKKAPYTGGSLYTFKSEVTVKLREDKFIFYGNDHTDPHLTIYIQEEDYVDSE